VLPGKHLNDKMRAAKESGKPGMKIYVAGHSGLVGSALVREIESRPDIEWVGLNRSELDLADRRSVFSYLAAEKPDAMIVAAAKVGGIMANKESPVDFLSQNIQISTNLLDAAHSAQVPRVLFLGSSCVYPKYAAQPIKEDSLLTGLLEETNEAYAIAKIAGIKLVQAYRQQFGHDWVSVMPTNLYGPGDNFHPEKSHVLPALIGKFHRAKISGLPSVTLWGTGAPLREFLHSDDLARAVLHILENYQESSIINVGSGQEISIKSLADEIRKIVGYQGDILWDDSVPDGTPKKLLDSTKVYQLGWKPEISLSDGIEDLYSKFCAMKQAQSQ
jgi:GDP-L-fucose synthase